MGMAAGGDGGLVSDINVTPLVDVMLCLLIIMMVVAPMLQAGVSVALPKSKYPDPDPNIVKDTSVVIAIPNDGEYYIGRDKIALADVPKAVERALKDKPAADQVVYIKSGQKVKYGTVVEVINAVRDSGFDRIGLVSEKEKSAEEGG
ncbi:MAG TPA: biopolymer transporter ExbD [Blastocatellia bacterium]|jgi:biopolymer transport protein ExbD|nr:biopolymer transporter ExbD [Blastocatellia bacterium]